MSVHVPRHPRHNVPAQHQHIDSIGLGKLTEGQMKAVVDLVKARGLLNTPAPTEFKSERGIVIAAGGRYADYGYVNARWLRTQGIQHPIQIVHLGQNEIPKKSRAAFDKLEVELVDAHEVQKKHRHRRLIGWNVKYWYAGLAPFRDVVFYDADCFARTDPNYVWDDPDYQKIGALFFSDIKSCRNSGWHYVFAGVRIPEHEFESGCFFWNPSMVWRGIRMTTWMQEHSEVWDKFTWGDKEMAYLGFGATNTPFLQSTEREWMGFGIEHLWKGKVICDHAMAAKRGEHNFHHPVIPGFFEEWRSIIS